MDPSWWDDDGPPPTPFERERLRRRRRRTVVVSLVALVALAAPALYAVMTLGTSTDDALGVTPAPGDDTTQVPDDDPGAGEHDDGSFQGPSVPDDFQVEVPDADDFDGAAADHVRLLAAIDASERTMLGFQLEVREVFEGIGPFDAEEVRGSIRDAAVAALDGLAVLRTRLLAAEVDEDSTEVRDRYVVHLDSWVDYLEAIEETPQLVTGDTTSYTIAINATGASFVDAVRTWVDTGVDGDVARLADDIVDRGFAGPADSQA